MESHSFTYEQYCTVIGKNIIMEETTFKDGRKKLRCLHRHGCSKNGGCQNKYVIARIKRYEVED